MASFDRVEDTPNKPSRAKRWWVLGNQVSNSRDMAEIAAEADGERKHFSYHVTDDLKVIDV